VNLRRLHPNGVAVTVEEVADSLRLEARAAPERPFVICNMVATADGKATVGGRSGSIGGDADRSLFHALRSQVDAVLVGTGTLRVERYGRLVRDAAAREARVRRGLAADPIACVVTRSGRVPTDIPLFQDAASTVVVYSAEPVDLADTPATVHVTHLHADDFGMAPALRGLRADHGVRSVLCEGGPTVLGALLRERVVDELFLTVAPQVVAGEVALTIVAGAPLPEPVGLGLVWALESDGELLLRYSVEADRCAEQAHPV
jgi:riboflavin-specific deaminase-like protein